MQNNITHPFFGYAQADVPAVGSEFKGINTPLDLYYALLSVWCADTCAPRLRQEWSVQNPTLGQCSITAFLAQDIFGGKVFGILLDDGNYHCYNNVDGHIFDLTSGQFANRELLYDCSNEQSREIHFTKNEKRERYERLKAELKLLCDSGLFVRQPMHRRNRQIEP